MRRWRQGSDVKRYSIRVRGKLPSDMAQRIARLHALAILQPGRGQATDLQTDESSKPTEIPTIPRKWNSPLGKLPQGNGKKWRAADPRSEEVME